jgi:hypothetical protein
MWQAYWKALKDYRTIIRRRKKINIYVTDPAVPPSHNKS